MWRWLWGPPILLMLLLLALNPAYMAHLIQAETRACALSVFIVIAGLTAMAFPSLLASLSLYRSGKGGLGLAPALLVILLFVVPASLLVLLAPAALLLL